MQQAEQTHPQASAPHAKNKIIRRRALEARLRMKEVKNQEIYKKTQVL